MEKFEAFELDVREFTDEAQATSSAACYAPTAYVSNFDAMADGV